MEAGSSEVRRLEDLLEVSQTLAATLDLRAALQRVLETLQRHHGARTGMVLLFDAESGELAVEAAAGLGAAAVRAARYRPGEGITGRVAQSGRPVVVPQASREPLFLNRTGMLPRRGKGDVSYVCLPVRAERRVVGALGVSYPYDPARRLDQESRFLGVVASLVGQAVRVRGLIESERRKLRDENTQLRQELRQRYDLRNLVGSSRAMQEVYEQVAQVAHGTTTVLIRGESGTGKELVAHAIHYNSARAQGPFVRVSCAALPESLVEAELFGHERGAFTDAKVERAGRFERAHGGTLFLDEVGELSPGVQVKLLRVLQEREVERLGGSRAIKVNVRVITATHKDLEAAVAAGTFREDLYYRLNVFSLFLPPLRERKTDIPALADHFVEKYAVQLGKDVRRIATSAIDMLMSYHWPGNVRELENCIERAVLLCDGGVIHAHHLPPTLQTAEVSDTLPRRTLKDVVAAVEKDAILDALKIARGNCARAARLLDTTERILAYKARRHGVEPKRFR